VPVFAYILTILLAYLLGSIPTGFLVGKSKGLDIRKLGSGNIGATNVFRFLGKPAGIFVLLMDAFKGWLAAAVVAPVIASWLGGSMHVLTYEWLKISAGLAAILGHNYTCWLYFKGGKGIATSAGVLIALVPWAFLVIFSVFLVVLALTRYVSLGSICAAAALPLAAWFTTRSINMTVFTGIMGALAIYKHRANIKRLLAGTESRIGRASVATDPPKAS
jgi:glycerol-3-phosphate acyltransferase PlsY